MVKYGYWLATHLPNQEHIQPTDGNVYLKKTLWDTRMLLKLHHFFWKVLYGSLSTRNNLKRRHVSNDDLCNRCWHELEIEKHLLFDCIYAKRIWRVSGISNTSIYDPRLLWMRKLKRVYIAAHQVGSHILRTYRFGCFGRCGKVGIHSFSA